MRQLSFAFLQAGQHIARGTLKPREAPVCLGAEGVVLRRINPAKNMARFYSLEVERDLLGRVVLVRRWG
jgi:WGR domain-containing protein